MAPHARQPRQLVLALRQLNLQGHTREDKSGEGRCDRRGSWYSLCASSTCRGGRSAGPARQSGGRMGQERGEACQQRQLELTLGQPHQQPPAVGHASPCPLLSPASSPSHQPTRPPAQIHPALPPSHPRHPTLPTCSLPSRVAARWLKMSRMSAVRSHRRTSSPSARSRLRSWPAEGRGQAAGGTQQGAVPGGSGSGGHQGCVVSP
jgi:hypothetical protein